MRVARDFAVGGALDARGYHAPERPRVADPGRRRRIADYLSGGTTIGRGSGVLHTDGLWLWPDRFVAEVLDRGLAPEEDLLGHIQRGGYRAAAPEPDARLTDDALRAWRAGPPPAPRVLVTYFVRLDGETTLEAPLSLLRRSVDPAGGVAEEALWRDLGWHPTQALGAHKIDHDIREVTPAHAAGVLDRWCAQWHRELISRATQ
ncbi:hypothetical protein ACFO1B_32815 [Dactylosporangium siamense]|uniref:Uncharacterized protein n=1 Tax=Dactylosporangium siamense TaxID=685454 RepID=A0A919U8Y7_9ACTN|nr:hypothetical protein [Dactylosporangium siamense]GIG46227.1 hypothetical protein Dsi01nite_042680 [Dactylosporangium siamense]